jgi:hypothetical protein
MNKTLKMLSPLIILSLAACANLPSKESSEANDRFAIEDTMTALFVKTDERDWKGVENVFADKVQFDMTSLTGGKPQVLSPTDITAGWDKGLKGIEFIHHQSGNYRVWIHGDEADSKAYAIAYHYKKKLDNRNTRVFVGSYDYHLKKIEGKWKIDLFRFNLQFIDGNKEL